MKAIVYSVQEVRLDTTAELDGASAALKVEAKGTVNSGGWSGGELYPAIYVQIPPDGILDLFFSAEAPKPGAIVTQGFAPISAHLLTAIPGWVLGVRVHSSTNSIVEMLPAPIKLVDAVVAKDGLPTPWPIPWFVALSGQTHGVFPDFVVTLDFPKTVTVNLQPPVPDELTVVKKATISISNHSGRKEVVTASNPSKVWDWQVIDETGKVVDSKKPPDMDIQVMQSDVIESGKSISQTYEVQLNGKALAAGGRYKLRFSFWNFQAETRFSVDVAR